MPGLPELNTLDAWHHYFAAVCNNTAWNLASQPTRTPEEDDAMLKNAFAAAYHWQQVGMPVNQGRADVTLAHVHSLLGLGQQALFYAQRSLDWFNGHPCEDWDLAFGHAEMAFAAAVAHQADLHREHYQKAAQQGAAIQDDEDREVFLEEFTKIPQL